MANENILTNKKIKFPSEAHCRPELRMLMQFRTRHGSIFNPARILLKHAHRKWSPLFTSDIDSQTCSCFVDLNISVSLNI